jgi:hypothetical protein
MMTVEVNEETSKFETVILELGLPIWRWRIIQKRAEALFDGDLGRCLSQLLDAGFKSEIKLLEICGPERRN